MILFPLLSYGGGADQSPVNVFANGLLGDFGFAGNPNDGSVDYIDGNNESSSSLSLTFSRDGTWTVAGSNEGLIQSGIWHATAPNPTIGDSYQVKFTSVAGSGTPNISNGAVAYTTINADRIITVSRGTNTAFANLRADVKLIADPAETNFDKADFQVNGTVGGGGGGGLCVVEDMWLSDSVQAKDAKTGDLITVINDDWSITIEPIEYARMGREECFRLITENGAILDVSKSTPFTLPDSSVAKTPEMLDKEVLVEQLTGEWGWEKVESLVSIGEQNVCLIYVGGRSYAAGINSQHRVVSHNIQNPKP